MNYLRKSKTVIVVLVLTAILGVEFSFGVPKTQAFAPPPVQVVSDIPRWLKEFVFNTLARTAAQVVSAMFLRSLTNWVRTGFKGSPQFVDDPEKFFKGVVRQGALTHQLNIMASQLCYPLGKVGVPGLVLQTPGVAGYPQLRCTMKNRNTQGFFDRFDNGGWQTWSEILQPQNNVYGMSALAQDAGSIQIANKTAQSRDEIVASQGFLSIKNCAVTAAFDSAVNGQNFTSQSCAQYKNLTPGNVVAQKIIGPLSREGSEFGKYVNVRELSDLIGAVTNVFINKLIGTKFMCLSCARGGPRGGQTITITGTQQQCLASACDQYLCIGGARTRTCFTSQSACALPISGCGGGQCLNCTIAGGVGGQPCSTDVTCPNSQRCDVAQGCTCQPGLRPGNFVGC